MCVFACPMSQVSGYRPLQQDGKKTRKVLTMSQTARNIMLHRGPRYYEVLHMDKSAYVSRNLKHVCGRFLFSLMVYLLLPRYHYNDTVSAVRY